MEKWKCRDTDGAERELVVAGKGALGSEYWAVVGDVIIAVVDR